MYETVDELIAALTQHKGKKLMLKDTLKNSHSFVFEIEDEDGTCVLVKSVRDYPANP